MTEFLLDINEDGRKRKRQFLFAWIAIALGVVSLTISFVVSVTFSRVANVLIGINFLSIGVSKLVVYRKKLFMRLSRHQIEWSFIAKEPTTRTVSWRDIRWIKKETDNSITIYRDSSFSDNIGLQNFSNEDALAILDLIRQIGSEENIQLINFLEMPLVLA